MTTPESNVGSAPEERTTPPGHALPSCPGGRHDSVPESAILRDIRLALGRIPLCDFQRLSQFAAKIDGRLVRGGLAPGAADLIGCVCGRFVALEVKRPGQNPRPEQERWLARMRRVGAVAEVVRSAAEAVEIVRRVIDEERSRRGA